MHRVTGLSPQSSNTHMPTSSPRPIVPRLPARLSPPWRVGVDVGGTFTDLVLIDAEGTLHVAKVPSTPSDPSIGVLAAVEAAALQAGLTARGLLESCSHFVHGSTVATNVVVERRGAPTGLIVTRGFRDSLEIRRGIRHNAWDHRRAVSTRARAALPAPPGRRQARPARCRGRAAGAGGHRRRRWRSSGGRASRPSPSASSTAS